MKKVLSLLLLLGIVLIATGCGKQPVEQPKNTANTEGTNSVSGTATTGKDSETQPDSSAPAAGIFLNGGNLVDVKLGIFEYGERHEYCSVKLPEKYIMGALFHDETGNDIFLDKIADDSLIYSMGGDTFLEEILQEGSLDETEYPISNAMMTSFGEDRTKFGAGICYWTMDEIKSRCPGGMDFGTAEHPAYYYIADEGAFYDLNVAYQINDTLFLVMAYNGPLADTVPLDKLAQDMYALVTVLE